MAPKGISRHSNPKRYNYLISRCKKLTKLAEVRGVNPKRAVRDFKFWCRMHNKNPQDFFIRGYYDTGYYAPPEFISWWDKVLANQGVIGEVDEKAMRDLAALLDEFIPKLESTADRVKRFNGRIGRSVEGLAIKARLLRSSLEV